MLKQPSKPARKVSNGTVTKDHELTLGQYLTFIFPDFDKQKPPIWPPDVFALCLAPLWKSAAYTTVLNQWPPSHKTKVEWAQMVSKIANEWRIGWHKEKDQVPSELNMSWKNTFSDASLCTPLHQLSGNMVLCQALLELASIADEASQGLGFPDEEEDISTYAHDPSRHSEKESEMRFLVEGDYRLFDEGRGSTLCKQIHPSRMRVLPKAHCPQSGLTIRSFSHHIALFEGHEITPIWKLLPLSYIPVPFLNLLIVPRPSTVKTSQFHEVQPIGNELKNMDQEHFGLFSFDIEQSNHPSISEILRLVKKADDVSGPIDGVILPELALSEIEFNLLNKRLGDQGIFLVSGVGSHATTRRHAKNEVHIGFPLSKTFTQRKHHRWKLDSSQITQYSLGGRLDPQKTWWEYIAIKERNLHFFALTPWLVMAPLICEDLARPDPVGDLVRAVGPNLVIALLMDGPQIKERWPARYATTLADDPGCSVLTITSAGMAHLSRPHGIKPSPEPAIALWKDAKSGNAVEITLPNDYDGIVLSLSRRYLEEWSADGRSDDGSAGYPALTGIVPVKL